ncbi:4-alpha-glucanotransferase [Rhizobium sp. BR 362]|uniref:4-alpha-glucanotransferase n=1 Tax=Rhizobium sp. BR 362 TaxID=3040670 RepID=UPI002F3EEF37
MKRKQRLGPDLERLAEKLGITATYEDLQGRRRTVPAETRLRILQALGFPDRLGVRPDKQWAKPSLDVPEDARCFLPASPGATRAWGISTQVYELTSCRNWGIGDFEDVRQLCLIAAEAGADFIGLNPLHALFLAEPRRCSPYSPSSRLFLNPLYLAVDKITGFRKDMVDEERLSHVRASEFVDYAAVATLKLTVLRQMWHEWNKTDLTDADAAKRAFDDFMQEGGDVLFGHCLFESLASFMTERGYGSGWQDWPAEFQNRHAAAVESYAADHLDDVGFHIWLQWLTAHQLQNLANCARQAGLRFGLYLDFAIGEVPDGSSTWSAPDLVLPTMNIGAPPDAFSAKGQDWRIVPLSPGLLADPGEPNYRRLIDRTARFAGALRLDHALGLWQLFLIPAGETAAAGGYLRYPFPDMISSLAVVSRERQTLIIGEDLGNVPEGFRPAMEKAGILGYKVLYFEDIAALNIDPAFPASLSLACLSTHDLPPLIGWWRGDDILFAEGLGWSDADAAIRSREDRDKQKRALLHKLAEARLIDITLLECSQGADLPDEAVVALHRLLAKTNSMLVAPRLADMVGEDRSTNVPGTAEEYPNWCLKLRIPVERLKDTALFARISTVFEEERPKRRASDCGGTPTDENPASRM